MTLIEHIKTLKSLTTERQAKFSEAFDYFMTNIGEKRSFESDFKPIDGHEILQPALAHLGQSIYGKTVTMTHLLSFYLEEQHFLHGLANFSNGNFLGFYFFEDVLTGMACNIFSGARGETDFYRLDLFMSTRKPAMVIPVPTSSTKQ